MKIKEDIIVKKKYYQKILLKIMMKVIENIDGDRDGQALELGNAFNSSEKSHQQRMPHSILIMLILYLNNRMICGNIERQDR